MASPTVLPEIESRFEVLAKLGEGGMGCVYKVRHRALNKVMIVKTLRAHMSADEGLRNRFINEASRGMELRHPHIAGVHDFQISADGTGFILMEYVEGHNLRDILALHGALPVPMVGEIAVQALDALGYLHRKKFVHRDISPDNLMLTTTDGRMFVKLIDLGIAKSLEAGQTMTGTGDFIGKFQYASPEQFEGELDGRSDLYSLGVVLFELLTNADAFLGKSFRELLGAHLLRPPRRFEEAAPDRVIPAAVQRVVFRALEKKPDDRYSDAAEFSAAVKEAFDVEEGVTIRDAVVKIAPRKDVIDPNGTIVSATAPDVIIAGAPTISDRYAVVAAVPRLRPIIIAAILIAILATAAIVWRRVETARLARYGKFYAVVIGESQYRKFAPLPTAIDDARAVARLLEDRYGFNVTRLENARRNDILTALQATSQRMTSADNLLVFYAGHGALMNGKGYWQPVDADFDMTNWISPTAIRDLLLDHPARRTLVIADSCYSGAIVRGPLSPPSTGDLIDRRSRITISSGGNAPVIDSVDGKQSTFTSALLAVLGDPTRKVIDVRSVFGEISNHVVDSARRAGREQKPELAVIAEVGDEGGTFYFVPHPKP